MKNRFLPRLLSAVIALIVAFNCFVAYADINTENYEEITEGVVNITETSEESCAYYSFSPESAGEYAFVIKSDNIAAITITEKSTGDMIGKVSALRVVGGWAQDVPDESEPYESEYVNLNGYGTFSLSSENVYNIELYSTAGSTSLSISKTDWSVDVEYNKTWKSCDFTVKTGSKIINGEEVPATETQSRTYYSVSPATAYITYVGSGEAVICPSYVFGDVAVTCFSGSNNKDITSIDFSAAGDIALGDFSSLEKLSSINLGSVSEIPEKCFYNDVSLKSVTVPDTVEVIGKYAFGYCSDGDGNVKIDGFSLQASSGSAAQSYAAEYGIDFVDLNENSETPTENPSVISTAETVSSQQESVNSTLPLTVSDEVNNVVISELKPKATRIKKLSGGKRRISVSWKKVKNTQGCQIQLATDKKFKKNRKTVTVKNQKSAKKTIKKLKPNKKYYVRIRTFRKDNGKKIYSNWSKIKSVKTK